MRSLNSLLSALRAGCLSGGAAGVVLAAVLGPASAARAQQCNEIAWIAPNFVGQTIPAARSGHAVAYDADRRKLVMFGGLLGGNALSGATWEYDGVRWEQVPVVGPSARSGHAMVYDSARQRIVLFGGRTNVADPATYSAATWEYDPAQRTWEQRMDIAVAPTGREGHAMAYDAARGFIVLHGGRAAAGLSGTTFEFEGVTWSVRAVPGPTARWGHRMAYDSQRERMVLFAGRTNTATPETFSGATWEWDGVAWLQTTPAGSPIGRWGYTLAYDAVRRVMVMHQGEGLVGGALTPQAATWEYATDPAPAWIQRGLAAPGPVARAFGASAYFAARGRVVLTNGRNANPLAETWELEAPVATPVVAADPAPLTVAEGGTATFTASAASGSTPARRWRRNGTDLIDDARISGAGTGTLTINPVSAADAGTYTLNFSNGCGDIATAGALLTVTPVSAACNVADVVSIGGFPPADGELTVDDYTSFINAFAGGELLADIVAIGGFPPADGELTVDDYTSFINAFAEGC